MKVPEKYRFKNHPTHPSDSSNGNNGFFVIPHWRINDYELRCMAGTGMGWEHLSVTVARKGEHPSRCPTWEEMCYLKDMFWDKDETVVQIHPPESEYVNMHPFCLHLWKKIDFEFPLPESIMVGVK